LARFAATEVIEPFANVRLLNDWKRFEDVRVIEIFNFQPGFRILLPIELCVLHREPSVRYGDATLTCCHDLPRIVFTYLEPVRNLMTR